MQLNSSDRDSQSKIPSQILSRDTHFDSPRHCTVDFGQAGTSQVNGRRVEQAVMYQLSLSEVVSSLVQLPLRGFGSPTAQEPEKAGLVSGVSVGHWRFPESGAGDRRDPIQSELGLGEDRLA